MLGYIFRALVITAISTPVYVLLRRPWRFDDRKREAVLAVFIVYLICLAALTLKGTYSAPHEMLKSAYDRIHTGEGINLVPFRTISGFFRTSTADSFWVNIISNVVIFIPWGFLLPCLWRKFGNIRLHIIMCLSITVFIELMQLFIMRNTDIDDVILNFLGGIIGGVLYLLINNKNRLSK